jgi:hypothetical protein
MFRAEEFLQLNVFCSVTREVLEECVLMSALFPQVRGGAVVQTSIRDAFSQQQQDRCSSHAASSGNRSVIFYDDSDD